MNSILQQLIKDGTLTKKEVLLVAVSGGIDSMTLLHFLKVEGYIVKAIHCNFQLRGEESEQETKMIQSFCESKNIPFLFQYSDAKKYADTHKLSLQMAAREIRYSWFEELVGRNEGKFVLTAHHRQDQVETFFINLLRGSGLKGLKGIPVKNKFVIRPFLNISRSQIEQYAKANQVPYHHDSSNFEKKYLRNKIRHELLPVLKTINPSYEQTLQGEMKIISEAHQLLLSQLEKMKADCTCYHNKALYVSKHKLKNSETPQLLLHHILYPLGFNPTKIQNILDGIENESGNLFYSESYRLTSDRENWILEKQSEIPLQDQTYDLQHGLILDGMIFQAEELEDSQFFHESQKISIDINKLSAPLILTHWQQGDRFYPLGMQGSKKLSDYFVSQKMSKSDKEHQWILRSGDEIVWVVGRRLDSRFAVSAETKKSLVITIQNEREYTF